MKQKRKKPGDKCPYCHKLLSKQFFIDRELKRGAKIKAVLAKSDMKGRPRLIDYIAVIHLREQGYSISQIMQKLSCGRGPVQHAIKLYGKGDKNET